MCKNRFHQKNGFRKQHTSAYYREHKPGKAIFTPYVASYATSEELETFLGLLGLNGSKDFVYAVASHFDPDSDEYQIALLHTTIKEKICNVETLQLIHVKPSVTEAILALTPIRGESHSKYISRVNLLPKAAKVYKYISITNRKAFHEKVIDDPSTGIDGGLLQSKAG